MAEYLFRLKKGKTIPWGYDQDDEDPQLLRPNTYQLDALEYAISHRKKYGTGLRPLAAWLSNKTGRYISHQGLKTRILLDKKLKNERVSSGVAKPRPVGGTTSDTALSGERLAVLPARAE